MLWSEILPTRMPSLSPIPQSKAKLIAGHTHTDSIIIDRFYFILFFVSFLMNAYVSLTIPICLVNVNKIL